MKIFRMIATAAIAALTLAGCNKEAGTETSVTTDPDAGLKEIVISIYGNATTKSVVTGPSWDTEGGKAADIDKYDIYFTSASDQIKYVYSISESAQQNNAWNALQHGQGIRFVGLQDVSRVYVVGNAQEGQTLAVNANMSELSTDLEKYAVTSDIASKDILYIGGDRTLTPVGSEPADNIGEIIVENGVEQATQYVTAEIHLRPVISRLEIGAIHVETTGTSDPVEIEDQQYVVTWSAFQPKLVGIYMSNVYGQLVPVTPAVTEGFATPSGTQITAGAWNESIENTEGTEVFSFADANAAMNANGVLYYSNYSGDYQDLFTAPTDNNPDDEGNYYYYNGTAETSATCVPFHFIVPFDVEAGNTENGAQTPVGPDWGTASAMNPAFHFQFDFSETGEYIYSVYAWDGSQTTGEPITDPDILAQLTTEINFADLQSDGIYYANVTGFYNRGNSLIAVQPNTIYKMADVGISPFNLTTGTIAVEEDYNIIVRVTPVDYVVENVTPSFE